MNKTYEYTKQFMIKRKQHVASLCESIDVKLYFEICNTKPTTDLLPDTDTDTEY